ncbi:MAG TPA: type II toxin-antitoxin system RelE/ParE family toxin [Solirubrobacteraceae bacterium]|nr:type II toxin-antitoxin system RelE/ParE family toxin [Solirubrobacteraceae bacterium]
MSDRPWQLVAASSARRDIQSLPEKYAAAVLELLPVIAGNPKHVGKPLRFEYEGRWSARRGPYRIIYSIDEASRTVTVLAVGHRADVYRKR